MPSLSRPEALARLGDARRATLGTTRKGGAPHLVPITFALRQSTIVTMVDDKPKTTKSLLRLENIAHSSSVSVLADEYNENWEKLWWVRVDGRASIHPSGDKWDQARRELAGKYPQYQVAPPKGPAIVIDIERVMSWASIA